MLTSQRTLRVPLSRRKPIRDTLQIMAATYIPYVFSAVEAFPDDLLRKAAGVEKGAATTKREWIAKVTRDQVREIATIKMADLNANDADAAMRQIEGTARSMGIEVVG